MSEKERDEAASTTLRKSNVEVEVDRVEGKNWVVDLASPSHKDGLRELLRDQTVSKDGSKDCSVSLSASVSVESHNIEAIVSAAFAASQNFQRYLRQYHHQMDRGERNLEKERENADRALHESIYANVSQVLSQQERAGESSLVRRESNALLADFSSAQALLEQGVDGYIQAVRKVLSSELDEAVTISYDNLSYTARKPKINVVDGFSTVASQLLRLACGCCIVSARAIRNAVRGEAPIEWEETPILKNVTGMIKPGRLTLVLGPPGCGKTSFLRAIAGKTMGGGNPGTVTTGDLRYNQRRVDELRNVAAWVSYVGQADEHQALLTVRETLEFAFKCRKAQSFRDKKTLERIRLRSGEAAVNRVKALKDVEVDIALALLGLTGCADTYIGNENLKGVSGGERRRVTLGEMLVTGSQIMCCDEISTGLDSAATFDITAYLRSAAHALRKSIIVALLQPPPEVIDLFDDIIVLAEGQIIYHGPREEIQGYFEGLGFRLPEGKDLGDFIVELPTRNGELMQLPSEEIEKLGMMPPPKTAEEFAARWRDSREFQTQLHEMELERNTVHPGLFDYDEVPKRSFLRGLWETIVWSMTLRLRDSIQIVARIIANLVVGFFFGTLFFQLTIDDWWLKAMLFAMALIFLVSTAFPVVQIISKQRAIFYKHVEARFYSARQFTLAQWIVSMPFVCFDVACFGCALYWMCGLAPHADAFVVFLAVCISFGFAMNTLMTMIPFITPDEDTGIVCAALYLILSVVASGALSTESMIPVLFRWMIWVNPFAWSYRALAINEYHTPEYDHWPCKFKIVDINLMLPVNCYNYFLDVREVRSDNRYIPAAVIVNFLFITVFLATMSYALGNVRFENEKTGAVPEPKGEGEGAGTGKPQTPSERNAARRNYESEKYLDAVSPRALHNLASGLPLVSPMFSQNSAAATPLSATNELTPLASNDALRNGEDGHVVLSPAGLNMLQTPPKTLIIKDLWYTIPIQGEPIDFLKGVSFYAKPGRMTALMGSSGAGKTTLMDVISGRKTVGYARGDILVNGEAKVQYQFVKYTGYVEQFGIHADCATIRESLEFSAHLRLPPGTSREIMDNYVQSVLELLELDDIEHALAGTLSMEQNKRLTLGVELVANPSIVFCDEPTSGLDARAAAIVMRVLLKVARSGRTVVATIHQPSTAIFNFFDDLLLLKRGGEVVYFGELGENSKELVSYLEAVPGTKSCPRGYNPATWMLEVIGAGTGADGASAAAQKDYAAIYKQSELRTRHEAEIEDLLRGFGAGGALVDARDRSLSSLAVRPSGISSPIASPFYHANQDQHDEYTNLDGSAVLDYPKNRTYVRGQLTQIKFLLKRNIQTYWRSPEFSLNRLLVVMLFTIVFACFFFMSELNNASDVQGRLVNIFFFSSLTCIYNLYTLVPFALNRRALYYRERSANMYSVWAFNWAEGLVEVPWIIVQVVATVPLIYFLTNLNQETWFPFAYFTVAIFLILLLMTSMGLFAASLFPDALAAQLASVGLLITLMTFCGIMVPKQNLQWYYVWLYELSFFKYSSEGLISTQFHDLKDVVCLPDGVPLEMNEMLYNLIKRYLPKFNGLCTKDPSGTFDWMHFINSATKISGVQMPATTFVLDDFAKDYKYEHRYIDLLVLIAWIFGLRLLTFIVMSLVNHQKR